ncbi:DNA methyltransferase family protein [Micromonospora profundi]|uniref:hypothetical protein n=1 Tax=Micromonospora profundi TaxID=1420889 RepID=UPI0036B98209
MAHPSSTDTLATRTELRRVARSAQLTEASRSYLGQYFTPAPAARLIASMPALPSEGDLRVLDPGAGIGSLTAAVVQRAAAEAPNVKIHVTTFEVDPSLHDDLSATLSDCASTHPTVTEQRDEDFIEWATSVLASGSPAPAAWLHDIGYAPEIVDTGFHALDGGRWLLREGFIRALLA